MTTLRDHAGSGRQPFEPVDVAKQRQALTSSPTEIFSADSFSFTPAFLRKTDGVDLLDMDDAEELGRSIPSLDFAVDQQLLTCSAPCSTR